MTPAATSPSEPVVSALGTVLRRLRRGRGLAQRDLLQPLHLGSHSAIVDYEAGRRIPPEAVIEAYERFFNLTPGTLARLREQALAERAAPEPAHASTPAPRQLPAAIEHFTGRTGELVRLDRLLRESGTAIPVVISAVNGMGGIGKTTLAVHWAHQARDSFPDGELYIDLQGFIPPGIRSPRRTQSAASLPHSACRRSGCPPRSTGARFCTARSWRIAGCWCFWTTPATPSR